MRIADQPTAVRAPALAASRREHVVTVACGLWMTIGLFLDGYFHQNLEGTTESFLTPWHAVFYAGFTASALWLAWMSGRRGGGALDWRLRCVPPGYGGARIGLVLFAAGGIGDGLWHTAFGVERGIDALLSPTHLVLFLGLVLILTAPFGAVFAAPASRPGPWIVVGSVTSAVALVGFFLNFAWGLGISALSRVPYDPVTDDGESAVIAGVASMLVATVVLFGSGRVLLAAGRPPRGAFLVLFGVVSLLVSAAFDEDIEGVIAAVAAGLALDGLLWNRRARLAPVLGAGAALLWIVYLGLLGAVDGIEWQVEIAAGAVVLSGLLAFAIGSIPAPSLEEAP